MNKEIILSEPLKSGKTEITSFTMRKPFVGDLRGTKLMQLAETDIDAIVKVLPRLLMPTVTEHDLYRLPICDLITLTGEFTSFLLANTNKSEAETKTQASELTA